METHAINKESECCDLESKIEIGEDLIHKAESAHYSEINQEINPDSSTVVNTDNDDAVDNVE